MRLRSKGLTLAGFTLTGILLLFVVSSTLVAPTAWANEAKRAWLRMEVVSTSAPNLYYQDSSGDAWLAESWVVETESQSGTTTSLIRVSNIHDADVQDITLVLVTNDPSVVSITVESPVGNTIAASRTGTGIVDMRTDAGELLADMPAHGVYNSVPTPTWYEYRAPPNPGPVIGQNGYVDFKVIFTTTNAPLDWKLHVDAYGWTADNNNNQQQQSQNGKKNFVLNGDSEAAVFVPFSHDITFTVPEFEAAGLLIASSAAILLIFRRKIWTNAKPYGGSIQ